jgi:hypothetical protein
VVVNVCFPAVLRLRVTMWDVHVVQGGVVVLVKMVGLQVTPLLTPVQVVGDVEVLVPVLHRLMLVMPLRSRHSAHRLSQKTAQKPKVHPAGRTDQPSARRTRL